MKTFKELQKDLQQIRTEAREIEARDEKVTAKFKAISWEKRGDIKQSIFNELNAIKTARSDNRIAFEIVRNNACIALYNEVMPIILDTLKAFEGKIHGEKTAAKIRDELKEKTNCFVYISTYELNISAIGNNGAQSFDFKITVDCGYNTETGKRNCILTNENKIKVFPLESFTLCYISRKYIEDISSTIAELKKLREEAYQQQQILAEICEKYNDLTVGNLDHLYIDKRISNVM